MKVFISQSKPRSLELALALEVFIRKVVQGTEPWVSRSGIDKGTRWSDQVAKNLKDVAAGLVVLTSENLDERWLLFEAGALSVKPVVHVWTYLLDVEPSDVKEPLSEFLHTKAEKAETFEMIQSIHHAVHEAGAKTSSADDVKDLFDLLWEKDLGPIIGKLRSGGPAVAAPKRSVPDLLSEILDQVRDSARVASQTRAKLDQVLRFLPAWNLLTRRLPLRSKYSLTDLANPDALKRMTERLQEMRDAGAFKEATESPSTGVVSDEDKGKGSAS